MDHVLKEDEITKKSLQQGIDLIRSGRSSEFNDNFRKICVGKTGPNLVLALDIVKTM